MKPQRHQQPNWSRFQGGPLLPPINDTPNGWALSIIQHLNELGMEIALILTPLSADPPMTQNTVQQLAGITMDQQKLLTTIGIQYIQDLAAPEHRNRIPIAYAKEKLKFSYHI